MVIGVCGIGADFGGAQVIGVCGGRAYFDIRVWSAALEPPWVHPGTSRLYYNGNLLVVGRARHNFGDINFQSF